MRLPPSTLACQWPPTLVVLASAALLVVASGCGDGRPARVPISGQVLIDGKPVTHGGIMFVPDGARASGGKLDKDGRFVLECYDGNDGAVLGTHRIEVAASEPLGPTRIRWHAPKKYADFKTSELTHEVTGPDNAAVINLTWAGGKPFVEDLGGGSEAPVKKTGNPALDRRRE